MQRRTLLKQMLYVTGGVVLIPSCLYKTDKASILLKRLTIDGDQEKMMADDCLTEEGQQKFAAGLKAFEQKTKKDFSKAYVDLSPTQKEGLLTELETGTAAADIIFGDVNPSGKLTITFPKSVGQLPLFYNHKPSAQFSNYVSRDVLPLYPFGFGLSFTSFSYGNLRFSADKIKVGGSVEVMVDVTNSGKIKGDEIVQLYINDKVASVTRPIIELKGFERISLNAGETKTVRFVVNASKLALWNYNMKFTVEPGEFDILVGKSSVDYLRKTLTVE